MATSRNDIWVALTQLNNEFAWRIDHDHGRGVDELFIEDGEYLVASRPPLRGRAALREFYRIRHSRGDRTSRHLFSNLHLRDVKADRVETSIILQLLAQDGPPPFASTPIMIADYDDVCVLDNGRWRFASRRVQLVFGAIPDLSARS